MTDVNLQQPLSMKFRPNQATLKQPCEVVQNKGILFYQTAIKYLKEPQPSSNQLSIKNG